MKIYREKFGLKKPITKNMLFHWSYLDLLIRKDLDITHKERIKRNIKVKDCVELLMSKYKCETPEYWQIIFASLLSGIVEKSDMSLKVYPIYISTKFTISGPQTLLAIYPNTTQKNLIDAFNSKHVQFLLEQQEQGTKQSKDDKWNKIKKIRKWYWWNIGGMSYSDISEKETGDRMEIEKTVSTYIGRYKKKLSEPVS